TDIGTRFVVKDFAKTPVSETRPLKTLEGVFGGMAFAIVLETLTSISDISLVGAAIVSAVVSLSSVFGDMSDCYLKRAAEVKDSGNIFPGHGGVLDRVDGYLFGAVVMLVMLRIII